MPSEAKVFKPYVRPSTLLDCFKLAATMRVEDREEIRLAGGESPLASLMNGLEVSSSCWTVAWGGEVVAMFGVSGIKGDTGFPWMLASDALSAIRKSFLRESKDYVDRMHEDYPKLINFAWSKNTVHLQWLQWLGFFFLEPEPYGESGELFIRFYKVKKNV